MYIDGTVIGVWALSTTALVMAMAAKVKFGELEDEIAALKKEIFHMKIMDTTTASHLHDVETMVRKNMNG